MCNLRVYFPLFFFCFFSVFFLCCSQARFGMFRPVVLPCLVFSFNRIGHEHRLSRLPLLRSILSRTSARRAYFDQSCALFFPFGKTLPRVYSGLKLLGADVYFFLGVTAEFPIARLVYQACRCRCFWIEQSLSPSPIGCGLS